MAAGFLGLSALYAVGTAGGTGRIAGAVGEVTGLINRALSPDVPAIPDRRNPTSEAAAGVAAGRALGGSQATGRTAPRLPIPAQPK